MKGFCRSMQKRAGTFFYKIFAGVRKNCHSRLQVAQTRRNILSGEESRSSERQQGL